MSVGTLGGFADPSRNFVPQQVTLRPEEQRMHDAVADARRQYRDTRFSNEYCDYRAGVDSRELPPPPRETAYGRPSTYGSYSEPLSYERGFQRYDDDYNDMERRMDDISEEFGFTNPTLLRALARSRKARDLVFHNIPARIIEDFLDDPRCYDRAQADFLWRCFLDREPDSFENFQDLLARVCYIVDKVSDTNFIREEIHDILDEHLDKFLRYGGNLYGGRDGMYDRVAVLYDDGMPSENVRGPRAAYYHDRYASVRERAPAIGTRATQSLNRRGVFSQIGKTPIDRTRPLDSSEYSKDFPPNPTEAQKRSWASRGLITPTPQQKPAAPQEPARPKFERYHSEMERTFYDAYHNPSPLLMACNRDANGPDYKPDPSFGNVPSVTIHDERTNRQEPIPHSGNAYAKPKIPLDRPITIDDVPIGPGASYRYRQMVEEQKRLLAEKGLTLTKDGVVSKLGTGISQGTDRETLKLERRQLREKLVQYDPNRCKDPSRRNHLVMHGAQYRKPILDRIAEINKIIGDDGKGTDWEIKVNNTVVRKEGKNLIIDSADAGTIEATGDASDIFAGKPKDTVFIPVDNGNTITKEEQIAREKGSVNGAIREQLTREQIDHMLFDDTPLPEEDDEPKTTPAATVAEEPKTSSQEERDVQWDKIVDGLNRRWEERGGTLDPESPKALEKLDAEVAEVAAKYGDHWLKKARKINQTRAELKKSSDGRICDNYTVLTDTQLKRLFVKLAKDFDMSTMGDYSCLNVGSYTPVMERTDRATRERWYKHQWDRPDILTAMNSMSRGRYYAIKQHDEEALREKKLAAQQAANGTSTEKKEEAPKTFKINVNYEFDMAAVTPPNWLPVPRTNSKTGALVGSESIPVAKSAEVFNESIYRVKVRNSDDKISHRHYSIGLPVTSREGAVYAVMSADKEYNLVQDKKTGERLTTGYVNVVDYDELRICRTLSERAGADFVSNMSLLLRQSNVDIARDVIFELNTTDGVKQLRDDLLRLINEAASVELLDYENNTYMQFDSLDEFNDFLLDNENCAKWKSNRVQYNRATKKVLEYAFGRLFFAHTPYLRSDEEAHVALLAADDRAMIRMENGLPSKLALTATDPEERKSIMKYLKRKAKCMFAYGVRHITAYYNLDGLFKDIAMNDFTAHEVNKCVPEELAPLFAELYNKYQDIELVDVNNKASFEHPLLLGKDFTGRLVVRRLTR